MTETKNIYQRLAAVMDEVKYIQKERRSGMQYTIVSHDVVTAKVRPALLNHGIVYHPVRCEHTHSGNRAECSMTVRFVNVDDPADFFDVPSFGYGIDNQDKGPGKAMSYAVKYALLKALGLETGDDPENDSINHDPKPAKPELSDDEKVATLVKMIDKAGDALQLTNWWGSERTQGALKRMSEEAAARVQVAYDERVSRFEANAQEADHDKAVAYQ